MMMTARDKLRVDDKVIAVTKRIEEIYDNRELLIRMLDEHKLDLMILALGIGSVSIERNAA